MSYICDNCGKNLSNDEIVTEIGENKRFHFCEYCMDEENNENAVAERIYYAETSDDIICCDCCNEDIIDGNFFGSENKDFAICRNCYNEKRIL